MNNVVFERHNNIFLKFTTLMLLAIIVLATIMISGCKYLREDEYTLEFTPNEIVEEVGKTFNIFDLTYKTNLPKSVTDNLKNNSNVEIIIENENLVTSNATNTITTVAEGKTKVDVVINYKNEEIDCIFNLIINKKEEPKPPVPDTEDKNPEENEPPEETDLKVGKFTYTYTYERIEIIECVRYILIIKKDGKGYSNYKITIEDKDKIIETLKEREMYEIITITENPIKLKITDTKDSTNTGTITLKID